MSKIGRKKSKPSQQRYVQSGRRAQNKARKAAKEQRRQERLKARKRSG